MEKMSRKLIELIADRFKLLASPTRIEILQHICDGERTVGELVELTGHKQANVSKQLGLLDRAGLVRRRVEGNHVYYTVADASLPQLCEIMRESLKMHRDELLTTLEE